MAAPPEDRWIAVDGGNMRYQMRGSGPPLLLLHGLLGHSFSWRKALPVFSSSSTVFAVDMLGAGFSDFPARLDCGLDACARRLLLFMDAVGVGSCDLLASSHGGAVAMKAASLAPGRFTRLILVAPVNPWSHRRQWLVQLLRNRVLSFMLVKVAPYLTFSHRYILRRLFGDDKRIATGTLEGYSAPFTRAAALNYGVRVLRTWPEDLRNLESVLPEIVNIPTLLIWGDRDRAVDLSSASVLKSKFQHCRLVVFPGVGHLPYEEVPDDFHRAVLDFLQTSNASLTKSF